MLPKNYTIDGFTTSAISVGEISALEHEVGDDTVELASLVCEWLSRLSDSLKYHGCNK